MARINPENTKVTLLKGGRSAEREVSLVSGAACAKALREEGFAVVEIDTADDDAVRQILDSDPDVVFIALHGKDGEDGCVQGLCELMQVPYTGSGVLASALAMDKTRAKMVYEAMQLPTAPWVTVCSGEDYSVEAIVAKVGEHCVVKPSREGSALGVAIVEDASRLDAAIQAAFAHDSEVVVESFVVGRELTVAVAGSDDPQSLPVIEIVPQESSRFYDYAAKYDEGGACHLCPADLPQKITLQCQQVALKAHLALGCFGVSRTDMILDDEGCAWLLETNTIPGMTPTSLLPDAAAKCGIGFGELCRKLVEFAFDRL